MPLIDFDDALDLLRGCDAPQRTERLPLIAAAGRFLAEPVALQRDQPGFDRATMDGYAVCLQPGQARYRVVGTVHAGEEAVVAPQPGEALRIMTGAPCPAGVAVIPRECTDEGDPLVGLQDLERWRTGANIAQRGEDGRAGDRVVAAGTRLTPAVLAAAAMAGVGELTVFCAPRLGLCTTGDELDATGAAGIADSNGPFLTAFARSLDLPIERRHAGDTGDALRTHLQALAASSDVLVTTGGVSAGDRDLVPAILAELGYEPILHGIAMQPGKPVLVARHTDGRFAVGLPGNPVSVLATAQLILAPVIGRFWRGWQPQSFDLPLACDWRHAKKRRLFLPARLIDGGVEPIRWNGSGERHQCRHGRHLQLPPRSA